MKEIEEQTSMKEPRGRYSWFDRLLIWGSVGTVVVIWTLVVVAVVSLVTF